MSREPQDIEILDVLAYLFMAFILYALFAWVGPEIGRFIETERHLDQSWEHHLKSEAIKGIE